MVRKSIINRLLDVPLAIVSVEAEDHADCRGFKIRSQCREEFWCKNGGESEEEKCRAGGMISSRWPNRHLARSFHLLHFCEGTFLKVVSILINCCEEQGRRCSYF